MKQVKNNENSNKLTLEERLSSISSNISSVQGWRDYISTYYIDFCKLLAKYETNQIKYSKNNNRPIAIITAGQPGSGKTPLLAKYKQILNENHGTDAVLNNADFYRFCIPGTHKIASDFPEFASELTDPVVKAMRKNLIEEAIKQKQSIIVENTLGDTIITDLLKQSDSHEMWITAMAVSRQESLLSDFERYIKMKDNCDVARLVSIEAHDKRYHALDKNIASLEKDGIKILVHSRGNNSEDYPYVEYDSSNTSDLRYQNSIEAINSIRLRDFKKGFNKYVQRLQIIREKMEEYGMTPEEECELEKLETIIMESIKERTR